MDYHDLNFDRLFFHIDLNDTTFWKLGMSHTYWHIFACAVEHYQYKFTMTTMMMMIKKLTNDWLCFLFLFCFRHGYPFENAKSVRWKIDAEEKEAWTVRGPSGRALCQWLCRGQLGASLLPASSRTWGGASRGRYSSSSSSCGVSSSTTSSTTPWRTARWPGTCRAQGHAVSPLGLSLLLLRRLGGVNAADLFIYG